MADKLLASKTTRLVRDSPMSACLRQVSVPRIRWLLMVAGFVGISCLTAAQPAALKAQRVGGKIGGFLQNLQWSPDGKRFLFTRGQGGSMALWTMAVDGT